MKFTRRTAVAACFLAMSALRCGPTVAAANDRVAPSPAIVVFAAASLTDALQQLADQFARTSAVHVKLSFAASSVLARQIESGAPADVFFSADSDWMDYLQTRNLLNPKSRHDVLGNRLVLIAPAGSTLELKIAPGFALLEALGGGRLATGDPESVPVGRYARAALTTLGVWTDVQSRIAGAENVRAALALVDRGEAPLGIVYETDARVDKGVRVVDVFPPASHPRITYPLALTSTAGPKAADFAAFLLTPAAARVFAQFGFVPLHQ